MNSYYTILDSLESQSYREHFLNDFLPMHYPRALYPSGTKYKSFNKEHFTPKLVELQKQLHQLNLPDIEYFLVFHHKRDQPIHVDGSKAVRYASLNLVLEGYEGTSMNYYNILSDKRVFADAQYFTPSSVEFKESFAANPNWVLVNSGEPHNIVGIKPGVPRSTICFRFAGNPTYESLLQNIRRP
jgi:hypothetical protein